MPRPVGSKVRRSPAPARLVVVGGSMGALDPLRALFARVPAGLDAAFVVVVHRSAGLTVLPAILARESGQSVAIAEDGQSLEAGRTYVAPGGLHTRIDDGKLAVGMGPRENGHRPSIDVLFRSAAQSFGNRVVGVVLSGALDCGAVGLLEIERGGGVTVVQDPATALNPQMPKSAIELVRPDHVVAPAAMGPLLARLLVRSPPHHRRRHLRAVERQVPFVCPECSGPIWEENRGLRYRCRTGHRFSADFFFKEKERKLEGALWEALNIMQERAELSKRMAARARENGHEGVAERFDSRVADAEENAALLRDVVYRSDGVLPFDGGPEKTKKQRRPKRPPKVKRRGSRGARRGE
ncbi:MAG: chemotaxis protein CheB [Myxococcales bacterium]|nr:chemotaxis protein CheB [Myxococcales bacterium]